MLHPQHHGIETEVENSFARLSDKNGLNVLNVSVHLKAFPRGDGYRPCRVGGGGVPVALHAMVVDCVAWTVTGCTVFSVTN
jgi:hypothetical protein